MLPALHVEHVILEAYATWAVYSTLKTLDIPSEVNALTPGGTPVVMHTPDGKVLA